MRSPGHSTATTPLRLLLCSALAPILTAPVFAVAAPAFAAPTSAFAAPAFAFAAPAFAAASAIPQTDATRGRKYKAPPETGHIEVQVVRATNGKPIMNAAVIFHPVKDGKDEGNLEVKTDPDGKATIDVIPIGSAVEVQVIASGFATNASDFTLTSEPKQIEMKMIRPRAQISTYEDNAGQVSRLKPGVQEMDKPVPPPTPATTPPPTPTQSPDQSSAPAQPQPAKPNR